MEKNFDMFSPLPDSLHQFIISLLPYKEAARTSILSKQWFETWRKTKKIYVEFDELFFVKTGESDESKEARRRDFLNFITHQISHNRNHFLDKFSLRVSHPESCHDIIESCVAFATRRGVKEFSLDFSNPNWNENNFDDHEVVVQLPQYVYELGSLLESLKLYSCGFSMPHMLNFRSMKEISLGWIEISDATLRTLLHTCKTLRNLSLKKCRKLESFEMGLEKLGLKRLVIDKCEFEYNEIYFDAPNLEFFKYSGGVWTSDININRDVMEEAEIDFPYEFEPKFNEYGDELYTILSDFYPVRVLTVCSVLLQDYEPPYNIDLQKFWVRPMFPTPECLTKTLKVVEIKNCAGTLNEIKACKYLIRVGKVLEELNINVRKDEHEGTRLEVMAENLPRFSRASENLKIFIIA
ncbi:putative F-box/LRR-repeat protein At1g56400 [Lotus japonicus]|uniref:putative F-box/LRR-repeat protein At1g56400 n=1 Tax=Lotus japonicus TaxID=34305 RepID=UPI0025904452|nr:putative F-box/LRR-repeat protein At1g56400 [Lotus japonicus]